ncbi:site-specific DNA-methyltransferase [Methanogenium marinum]|uniref:Type II methyltransferase n=1 Tax=Methanogenium marinum TaxID=348610 RepID=A0A9Q4PUS1_9EURY|nr:site-specific DNA-methyltransferase [Methanogenium marinum]MDE4907210.1 site-specific DNA-methyltransferase [Methanogenium marinum]
MVKMNIDMDITPLSPYYQREGAALYCADCRILLRSMPESSVDMIFADPPYNLSNGGFTCQGGKRVPVDKGEWDASDGFADDLSFHQDWIAACRRVLKDEGTLWVSGTYHSIYACGYALQSAGFHILNDICWFKPNAPPNLSARFFTASHETIIWARKSPDARHTFNYEDMKGGDWHEGDMLKNDGKQMRSVWSVPAPRKAEKAHGKHPTQKPLALLNRIILAATNPGDLVVDPFTGSSTTGIAAVSHGRRFIGSDVSPEYLDMSVGRFEDLLNQEK